MYKKLFLCLSLIGLANNTLYTADFSPKKCVAAWMTISKSVKYGCLSTLFCTLPAALIYNKDSITEKIALPIMGGIAGGIIGLIGGMASSIRLAFIEKPMIPISKANRIVDFSKGMSLGFGASAGLLATLLCYLNKESNGFNIFKP